MTTQPVDTHGTQSSEGELPRRLNLGCGPDYRPRWHNVDLLDTYHPDQVADITDTPWDLPANHFHYILMSHVLEHIEDQQAILEECARVLAPLGVLEVRYPMGRDFVEDPDHVHENEWDWRTPERLCGQQPWDADCGLVVDAKETDVWSHEPGTIGELHGRYLDWREDHHGSGRWQFSSIGCTSGEFRVTFRKPAGDDA